MVVAAAINMKVVINHVGNYNHIVAVVNIVINPDVVINHAGDFIHIIVVVAPAIHLKAMAVCVGYYNQYFAGVGLVVKD